MFVQLLAVSITSTTVVVQEKVQRELKVTHLTSANAQSVEMLHRC